MDATDPVQIGEYSKELVATNSASNLAQGEGAHMTQSSSRKSHWQYYRTRILSTADQVNLKFEEAQPKLEAGISTSISGILG